MASTPRTYAELKALVDRMREAGFDPRLNESFNTILQKVDAAEAARAAGTSAYDVQQLEEKAMKGVERAIQRSNSSYNAALSDLQTKVANLANFTATEEAANSVEGKQRAASVAKDIEDFNANFAGLQPEFVSNIKQNSRGYYEQVDAMGNPKSAALSGGSTSVSKNNMRLGEPVRSRLSSDGKTWEVYGVESGKIFQSGFADVSAAEKWANKNQSGGTADAMGAFDTPASSGGTPSGSGSSILPSGIDTTGLTKEQVSALEQAYMDASGDTSLASKLAITDADIEGFLEKAQDESDPYYNQIYTRAKEDYERGLKYKADVRDQQISQELLEATIAKETLDSTEADAGRAFSGLRLKAEARLKEQTDNIARASRRDFNEEVMQFGRSAEDLVGSKQLANVAIPQIQGTDIYTPTGGITGSVERDQLATTTARAAELEKNQALRNLGTLPESAVATEEIAALY